MFVVAPRQGQEGWGRHDVEQPLLAGRADRGPVRCSPRREALPDAVNWLTGDPEASRLVNAVCRVHGLIFEGALARCHIWPTHVLPKEPRAWLTWTLQIASKLNGTCRFGCCLWPRFSTASVLRCLEVQESARQRSLHDGSCSNLFGYLGEFRREPSLRRHSLGHSRSHRHIGASLRSKLP